MNIQWDADTYTSDFAFVHQYGKGVAELIDAPKGSSVLDLGCGNGALSHLLQERGFSVTGLDASTELLAIAKKNYPDLTFLKGDATDFSLKEPVDVVFSNAVFHWIDENRQPDMLGCVYRALKKNGQFVFEMGGYGNNRLIHETLRRVFGAYGYSYQMPFYFPTVGEYAVLLEKAGFRVVFAAYFDRMTELKGPEGLKEWIKMFDKTPFSVVKKEEEKEAIMDQAVRQLEKDLFRNGKWYADYVRLRMKAIKE